MSAATFVLCIEDNAIRAQALLLCESLRTFGGRFRRAPIVAVAARPGLGVGAATRRRLSELDVEYVEEPLNTACPEYGSANRVFAAAWAEARAKTEWIVVLDSDTVFVDEPRLPEAHDVGVRPVDSKGSTTEGPHDPFEAYWVELGGLCGASLDVLPFLECTISGHRVRASYNGGLVVTRRRSGILGRWSELFALSVARGLRPFREAVAIRASTGMVAPEAARHWGSNQAALAFAIWTTTARVALLPDSFNVPLHALAEKPEIAPRWRTQPPIHLHYHWMFSPPHVGTALSLMRTLGVPADRLRWAEERLPLE